MLTDKQRRALDHYIADPDRSEVAAYKAAYKTVNKSQSAVYKAAKKLFSQPEMVEAIQRIQDEAMASTRWTAATVLEEAIRLYTFNIRDFLRPLPDGQMVYDFSKATREDWHCIDELTIKRSTQGQAGNVYHVEDVKIKTTKKLDALKFIAQHTDIAALVQRQQEEQDSSTAIVDAFRELAASLPG